MTTTPNTPDTQLTLQEVTALQLVALAVLEAPDTGDRRGDRRAVVELGGTTFVDLYRASTKLGRALLVLAGPGRAVPTPPARQTPNAKAVRQAPRRPRARPRPTLQSHATATKSAPQTPKRPRRTRSK